MMTNKEETMPHAGATRSTSAKACNVLTHLLTGNPHGARTTTVRGRPCRLSIAPAGESSELKRLEICGPVLALVWRNGDRAPSLNVAPEIDGLDLDNLGRDVSVALVTSDQDFVPTQAFELLAEALAAKAGLVWDRTTTADEWTRCLGEGMVDTADILLAMNRVPGY